MSTTRPRKSGPRIHPDDIAFAAVAFGFNSPQHMQDVLDGKAPSALEEGIAWEKARKARKAQTS